MCFHVLKICVDIILQNELLVEEGVGRALQKPRKSAIDKVLFDCLLPYKLGLPKATSFPL